MRGARGQRAEFTTIVHLIFLDFGLPNAIEVQEDISDTQDHQVLY